MWTRVRTAFPEVLTGMREIPEDLAHVCQYNQPAQGNCTVLLLPHEGYRENGSCYCSYQHAVADQEDAPM